jgi:hypothetical protein
MSRRRGRLGPAVVSPSAATISTDGGGDSSSLKEDAYAPGRTASAGVCEGHHSRSDGEKGIFEPVEGYVPFIRWLVIEGLRTVVRDVRRKEF